MRLNIVKSLVVSKLAPYIFSKRLYNKNLQNSHVFAETTWDVIISGGGMVGGAFACALGSSRILETKKILLLETRPNTEYNIDLNKYSNRVCALNKNTKSLFESFNAWEKLSKLRMKEVKKMCVWESSSDARITFQHEGMVNDIAYIVENDVILNTLYSKIDELRPRVQILTGAKAVDYVLPSDDSEFVTVNLADGIKLKTKLLVGADGVQSLVRKKMNIKYVSWNYDQKGIVATLRLSEPTENVVAWQRFLPTGPIALLPLTDDLCSLVWTVSVPMCEKLLKFSNEEFVDALNSALWDETGKNSTVESVLMSVKNVLSSMSLGFESTRQLPPSIISVENNSRAAFPLGLGHSTFYVAPRVALIGDSAHRVHPLAGQGVNLGFGDVQCLTETLESSVYDGNCIGDLQYLLDYEVKRQRHVVPMMFSIDALQRLYKTEFMPIVLMRSLGVTVLDALNPIKDRIISRASS